MASQCELVLDHLKNHGSISHKEAEELYGIARLAARIADLRKLGVRISSHTETGKNRRGETRGMDESRHGAQVKWNGVRA